MLLLKEYFYGQIDLLQQVLPSFSSQDEVGKEQQASALFVLHGEELVDALNRL